ncbi:MAG TPA: phosphoribosyltransferase family protein [Flavisolibacter sp.]
MFYDRKEAALLLAKALEKYRNMDVVVLGIPRGGAVMGYYVALHLHAEFSLLVAKKLGHPRNPEYAIGAIAEDGTVYLKPAVHSEVSPEQIDTVIAAQKKEMQRRIHALRNDLSVPEIKNRVVILVDDGIATGATMMAAIHMCKNKNAAKIVVAAPVADMEQVTLFQNEADEIIILNTPEPFYAVSQAYHSFPQVEDEEVVALLGNWKLLAKPSRNPLASQQVIDEP